jgi:ethanolamine utilization cobalamin adenosyltransferase
MQAVGTERTIFWTPQEKFYAKNTCNLPQATKVQTIIDAKGKITGQNNFLTNVFGAYQNYLNEQAEVAQKYNALIDDIKEVVEFVTDSISADGAMQAIIGKDHIWDSKLRGSILLNEKCKTLGLKFNKLTNHYEQAS